MPAVGFAHWGHESTPALKKQLGGALRAGPLGPHIFFADYSELSME